jgi:antitoxin PrlF
MDADPYHVGMKATVGERGQVTIPKPMRDRLGIRAGQQVEFKEEPGRLIVSKAVPEDDPVTAVYGILKLPAPVDELVDEMRGPADVSQDP